MSHIERVSFRVPLLLSSLQQVLGDLSPPPFPMAVTSLQYVVYGTKLSSEQSGVLILLFAHPSLRLEEVRLLDGWTRINKRARIILDAIIGVKVDSRWLNELTAYWDALPANVKHTLQHKHGGLTEVAGTGRANGKRRTMGEQAQHDHTTDAVAGLDEAVEDRDTRHTRITRKRRAVHNINGRLEDGSDTGSASVSTDILGTSVRQAADRSTDPSRSAHVTSSVSYYAQLAELYDTIVYAFDKYNDIACELEERKDEYATMEERERLWNEQKAELQSQLQARQAQLEEEKSKLSLDGQAIRENAAEVEKRAAQAENDARHAQQERKEAEAMQKRLESYAVQGMLSQPDVLIEAVRQLVATSKGHKVLRQLQTIVNSAGDAATGLSAQRSPTPSEPSISLPMASAVSSSASPSSSPGSTSSEATAVEALSSFQQTS